MKLTLNDWRVLKNIAKQTPLALGGEGNYDSFMPHGSRDWTAVYRLREEKFIEEISEYADCQTCYKTHEGPAYIATHWGFRALQELKDSHV